MKQIWLLSPGKIRIKEVPLPYEDRKQKGLAPGELLVKIKAALTCGTDLKAYLRGHRFIPMPGPLGHEFSGVVEKTGGKIHPRAGDPFRVGDEIMAVHTAPCLGCPCCRAGLYNLCERIMETKVLGAFGEYLIIPAHIARQNVFRKPKGLSFEEACFLEPLSCVVHGLKRADIPAGRAFFAASCAAPKALVFGAGPIGLLHLLLLKAKGVEVSVCDPAPKRLSLAKKLGAASAFKPPQMKTRFKKFAPSGADYVFECTGRKEVWQDSVNYLRRGGTAVLFGGLPPDAMVTFPAGKLHYDEIKISGSFHFTPEDVLQSYRLLASGKINVKPLISGVFPLEKTGAALEKLSRGEGIKYVIRP